MCTLYVLTAFTVCLFNIHHLPHTIVLIIKEAFTPQAISGGMFACMLWGFRRAMFANESGLGTAPIAFSAVKTSKPVVQAFIAMLQPFVDTVIVGSATAFVIVVSGVYLNNSGLAGIELTSKAFGSVFKYFFQFFKHIFLRLFYSKFIKNVITRLFKKSANRLPTSGMSRYALMDGTYWSQTACIFAMAFGVAPVPKPQVPDTSMAAS